MCGICRRAAPTSPVCPPGSIPLPHKLGFLRIFYSLLSNPLATLVSMAKSRETSALMLSFALNYNSAYFYLGAAPWVRSPAPMGAAHPGVGHGCPFWALGWAGGTKQGGLPGNRSPSLQKRWFWGTPCTPKEPEWVGSARPSALLSQGDTGK